MPLFKSDFFFTRLLAYFVDKHLKSHWEFSKFWLSKSRAPKYNILYWFWNTFAFNIVTKNSQFVFIYPIISHCEQQIERKYLAADENYSHTNVMFLYASIIY